MLIFQELDVSGFIASYLLYDQMGLTEHFLNDMPDEAKKDPTFERAVDPSMYKFFAMSDLIANFFNYLKTLLHTGNCHSCQTLEVIF